MRAAAAGQQGGARDRRRAGDGEGAAAGQGDPAGGQRALGDLPVPAGPGEQPRPQAASDRVGRAVPHAFPRGDLPRDGQAGAWTPHLEDGREDHRGLRDDDEQGPGGHRGAPPLRRAAGEDPGGRTPAERDPLDDRVRGRRDSGAAGQTRHARPDQLRAGLSRAPALWRRADRLDEAVLAHLRAARPGQIPLPEAGLSGAGGGRDAARGAQCRQRGRQRGLPPGTHLLRPDQRNCGRGIKSHRPPKHPRRSGRL